MEMLTIFGKRFEDRNCTKLSYPFSVFDNARDLAFI